MDSKVYRLYYTLLLSPLISLPPSFSSQIPAEQGQTYAPEVNAITQLLVHINLMQVIMIC